MRLQAALIDYGQGRYLKALQRPGETSARLGKTRIKEREGPQLIVPSHPSLTIFFFVCVRMCVGVGVGVCMCVCVCVCVYGFLLYVLRPVLGVISSLAGCAGCGGSGVTSPPNGGNPKAPYRKAFPCRLCTGGQRSSHTEPPGYRARTVRSRVGSAADSLLAVGFHQT